MASKAENVPREGEVLCESCGYGLEGVIPTGEKLAALEAAGKNAPDWPRCPECGESVANTVLESARTPTAWESTGPKLPAFIRTTVAVLRSPRGFFRRHRAKTNPRFSRPFAFAHYAIAAYFFAIAATLHYLLLLRPLPRWLGTRADASTEILVTLFLSAIASPLICALMTGVRLLTGRLSTFESRYHGLRLPLPVVTRALHYHAACLLPVSLGTLALVVGYRAFLALEVVPPGRAEIAYIYGLGGWVVVAAVYLFITYWAAMKSVMYASR